MAITPVSKNLIGIFFADEALKKDYAPPMGGPAGAAVLAPLSAPALVGAGKMGGGIAALASSVGLPLRMKDIGWDAIGRGYAAIREIYDGQAKRGKLDEREAALKMHLVSSTVDYSGFRLADIVIEAIVEDRQAKAKAYAELEDAVGPETIIATNTSSLAVDELAAGLRRPERFIGFHFFNPVDRMPLIEVVPGRLTSPETLYRCVAFARRLRKTPIVVKDCHGFLVNRVLMAYLDESLLMLEEGTPFPDVDRAMLGFGMPLGPFALIDEIGIKVAYKVAKVMAAAYPERSGSGRLLSLFGERPDLIGKASRRGFYLYGSRGAAPNPDIDRLTLETGGPGGAPRFSSKADEIVERSLSRMVNEAALCLGEGIVDRADYLDMAMLLGTGFPAFRGGPLRYADSLGPGKALAAMRRWEDRCGSRFAPAPMLVELANSKGSFYP
jgi:3-hydroxyacyl-CoA dehydrogenase/enoyl-CoA hydratase/3-hydroxybutyryl-CoA epimerase